MRKLAVFCEGYTEVAFARRLIEEIAGASNVVIEHRKIVGGSSVPRRSQIIEASNPVSGQQYFFLLIDCGGDVLVKARVLEEHANLSSSGYEKIIAIRDVRPDFQRADIPRLERGLRTYIRTALVPVEFILAVMETEAWFLAESTHFARIDNAITPEAIKLALGFDVENDDMSLRESPTHDLHSCYAIAGLWYSKSDIDRTVGALDFARVYLELPTSVPYIGRLVRCFDEFLSPGAP